MSSPSLTRGSLYGILDFILGILEFLVFNYKILFLEYLVKSFYFALFYSYCS